MATESVSDRINRAACSIDGIASMLADWVQHDDKMISRQSYACWDLLDRISNDLSDAAASLERKG